MPTTTSRPSWCASPTWRPSPGDETPKPGHEPGSLPHDPVPARGTRLDRRVTRPRSSRTGATLFVALALAVGAAAIASAQSPSAKGLPRIGVLLPRPQDDERGPDVLQDGLRDAGWV